MIPTSELKEGTAFELDGKLYKVIEVARHLGAGQMQSFMDVKLYDMRFGHYYDRHLKITDKVKEVVLTRRQMEFLYQDRDEYFFMDPETFEQISIPGRIIGKWEKLLKEGLKIMVELLDEEPVFVQFPKTVEVKVARTGEGTHEIQDNTMKAATLENGLEILVPQFIQTGEVVRIDTDKMKYVDRVSVKRNL